MNDTNKLPSAFDAKPLELTLERILPSRPVPKDFNTTRKYGQIKSSILEIGLIEPLSVTVADPKSKLHVILDGHMRFQAIRELGHQTVSCIIANDDDVCIIRVKNRQATFCNVILQFLHTD